MVDSKASSCVLIQNLLRWVPLSLPGVFLCYVQASIYPNECSLVTQTSSEALRLNQVSGVLWRARSPSLSAVLCLSRSPSHSVIMAVSASHPPITDTRMKLWHWHCCSSWRGWFGKRLAVCVRLCVSIKSHFRPTKMLRFTDCYNAAPVWQAWLCRLMGLTVNVCV